MLNALRKGAKTWVAKVLFLVLVLSFAVWGVGDMVTGGLRNAPAITAGAIEVPPEAVVAEYRRELNRLQRTFGDAFTEEQARQMGLLERTIDNMVARALLDQAARELDLVAPDEVVRRAVAENPAFRNELGGFDQQRFRAVINQAGYTEEGFIQMARLDLLRGQLIAAVTDGVTAPEAAAKPLYTHLQEKRTADVLRFDAAAMPAPEAPPAEQLQQYWQEHQQRFMAPEYRSIAGLLLTPADVADEIEVTDEMIEDAYQQRLHEFQQPERRNIRQLVFGDQQAAEKALELTRQNMSLSEAADSIGQPLIELGWMDRQGLEAIDAQLAEAVFAAPVGGVTQPVQSPLGWHLVQVTEVEQGRQRAIADVRDQLRQDVVREKAIDLMYEMGNKVQDTLAGGATLEEAAEKLNLRLVKAEAVDPQGRGPSGEPIAELPSSTKFLTTAFETPEGTESFLTEMENDAGFFVVRVDDVTPPAVRPFETVRDEVLQAWQAEKKLAAARAKAEEAAAKLKAGEPVDAVAEAFGVTASKTKPFTRQPGAGADVSPQLAAQVFAQPQGGVAVVSTPTGASVARVDTVVPASPEADPEGFKALKAQMAEAIAADLIDQYVAALNQRFEPTVNRQVINERLQ